MGRGGAELRKRQTSKGAFLGCRSATQVRRLARKGRGTDENHRTTEGGVRPVDGRNSIAIGRGAFRDLFCEKGQPTRAIIGLPSRKRGERVGHTARGERALKRSRGGERGRRGVQQQQENYLCSAVARSGRDPRGRNRKGTR